LVALAACGSTPPSTATVRAKLTSDLGNVLHNAKDASDGSTANLPGGTAFSLASTAFGSATSSARILQPLQRFVAPSASGNQNVTPASNFDPDAIIQWLDDNIFVDANKVEDGIYRVPPDLFCTTTTVDSGGNTITSVDPNCVSAVTTAQLRVRVEENNATLRFAIQVDASHDEPLSFELTHTSLAMTIDLDQAGRAMLALAAAFGEMSPNASLSGQVTAKLEILGAAHGRATLTIDRAITVKVAAQGASLDGPDATRFTSAQANVLTVEGDANAPLFAVDLGLGETTVHLPGDPGVTAATDVDLAGVTANTSYTGGNALTISHVSLGDKTSTVAKDGVIATTVDLNANDGRALNVSITADPATGTETIAVSPRFDLQTSVDHAVLGDTPPEYDVTRVQLDGALSSVSGSNIVRVASGSYSITTNPAQYGFSATAGQCVTSTDTYDSVTFNDYTAYSVAACQ
jgi:hypothetical protein